MKKQLLGAASAALLLSVVPAVHAVPEIRLSVDSGAFTASCVDQALCDSNPAVGAVTYIAPIAMFTVTVTSGVSKALVTGNPLLSLNTLEVTSLPLDGLSHTLDVGFSDIGFGDQGPFSLAFGGTLNGPGATVEASAAYDAANALFQFTTPIGAFPATSLPAFAFTLSDGDAPAGPYSVSQNVRLTTSATEITNLNAGFVVNVPEPGTLALLGLGLLAFGFRCRRQAA